MNKKEFLVSSTSFSLVYMSSVLQYEETANDRKYLVFASKEKNHLYISRASREIESVSITLGSVSMESLLTINNTTLFIDITELLATYEGTTQTMTLHIKNVAFTETLNFYVVIAKGYRYDRLAQYAQIPYIHSCDNVQLSTYQYDSLRTLTFALPPTTIIVPINDEGISIFQYIKNIELPFWRSHLPPSSISVKINNNEVSTSNDYGLMKINVADLLAYGTTNASLYVVGTSSLNSLRLQKMQNSSRYLCVKWLCPYITTLYFSETSGGSKTWTSYQKPQTGIAFFEVISREISTEVTELEGTASYMPYQVKESQTITIGLRNITAYDYIYYSQILQSEDIAIIDAEYFPTSDAGFQPVRLKKTKLTMPQNGSQLYNLEIELIIE